MGSRRVNIAPPVAVPPFPSPPGAPPSAASPASSARQLAAVMSPPWMCAFSSAIDRPRPLPS